MQAIQKKASDNPVLAITDGTTQGSVPVKETIKKLRARSALGKRDQSKKPASSQGGSEKVAPKQKDSKSREIVPVNVQDNFGKPPSRVAAPLPFAYFDSVSIADNTQNDSIIRRSAEISFEDKLKGFSMANIIKNK